jgi:dinuclear metal center YbgI/SA1388 family protein
MSALAHVLEALERIAPRRLAMPGDRIGLQVGTRRKEVKRGLVSLDRSKDAAQFAISEAADVWVCHHPLIWDPLRSVLPEDHAGGVAYDLIQAGIAFIAAHTNWDAAPGGVNDALAERLELQNVEPLGDGQAQPMLKLVTFCPRNEAEALVDAMSAAGAGRIGAYTRCAYLSDGTGTFRPETGANPAVGEVGRVETVAETRIEMVLPSAIEGRVVKALRANHPYEEPAYDLYALNGGPTESMGRVGNLAVPFMRESFSAWIDKALGTRSMSWFGGDVPIQRVAVLGGSGDFAWTFAKAAGAQALVTGEVRQQVALEASENDVAMVSAGHYATEQPGCEALWSRLMSEIPDVHWLLYRPGPGRAGKPV